MTAGANELEKAEGLLQSLPQSGAMHFAIDRGLRSGDEDLRRFFRTLRGCKLAGPRIDFALHDP